MKKMWITIALICCTALLSGCFSHNNVESKTQEATSQQSKTQQRTPSPTKPAVYTAPPNHISALAGLNPIKELIPSQQTTSVPTGVITKVIMEDSGSVMSGTLLIFGIHEEGWKDKIMPWLTEAAIKSLDTFTEAWKKKFYVTQDMPSIDVDSIQPMQQ